MTSLQLIVSIFVRLDGKKQQHLPSCEAEQTADGWDGGCMDWSKSERVARSTGYEAERLNRLIIVGLRG